jgi:hypothetical protein
MKQDETAYARGLGAMSHSYARERPLPLGELKGA